MRKTGTPTPFVKMHGLGNDFVIFDAREQPLALTTEDVRLIADRRHGVGCDQVILLRAAEQADLLMTIFNADGSEAEACGNASRCVGALLAEQTGRQSIDIATRAGRMAAQIRGSMIEVDMGPARTDWQDIPLAQAMDTAHMDFSHESLSRPGAVSMGNPHVVFFVDKIDAVDLTAYGPVIERHPLFPNRVNVSVAQTTQDNIRLRVWERGVGITQACGTAACAALVAAHRQDRCGRSADVELDGGTLHMQWREDGHVIMTGPAAHSFSGEIRL